MPMSRSFHHRNRVYAALVVATLLLAPQPLDAEKRPDSGRIATGDLSGIEVVDVLNLFSNVGSLIYFVEPNAVGLPPGIISQCTGTLILERAFLVAGHCTSQTQPGLPPFVKPYVPLSPNALDQSEQASRVTWLRGRSTAFSSRLDRSDEVPDRYRADSNWLLGYSPDLPGCIATANTRDEIEQEMKAAIAFHLDSLKAEGMAIPKPSSSSSS